MQKHFLFRKVYVQYRNGNVILLNGVKYLSKSIVLFPFFCNFVAENVENIYSARPKKVKNLQIYTLKIF